MLMQNKYIGMCELGFIFLLLFPWFTLFVLRTLVLVGFYNVSQYITSYSY